MNAMISILFLTMSVVSDFINEMNHSATKSRPHVLFIFLFGFIYLLHTDRKVFMIPLPPEKEGHPV